MTNPLNAKMLYTTLPSACDGWTITIAAANKTLSELKWS